MIMIKTIIKTVEVKKETVKKKKGKRKYGKTGNIWVHKSNVSSNEQKYVQKQAGLEKHYY